MKRVQVACVALLAVLSMAPTVGDTGGCGREASYLEADRYTRARKLEDCKRCNDCGIQTARCARACDPSKPPDFELPSTCQPLVHDGEVCLRALDALSCDDYANTVADDGATSPSECQFCRVAAPLPTGSFADGGP